MRISAKHEQSVAAYNDFSGGLNFTVGADAIADNQFSVAENVEYGALDGSLSKVAGFVPLLVADAPIHAFMPIGFRDVLFVSDRTIYRSDYHTHTVLGECTGKAKPVIVAFGDAIYIASGETIQKYKDGVLSTVDGSPRAEYIFAQENRLAAVHSDSRRMHFSGVLDASNWKDDTENDSSAKWIDIGDNDAGTIRAVGRLFQDLIIFTSTNKAFRLTGSYPNWAQLPLAKDAYATNFNSIVSARNSLFFLGAMGFQAIQSTQMYGDMETVNVGHNINNFLTMNIQAETCSVWSLPTKWQIWIQPQESGLIYIFHTQNGAFTTRRMKGYITHATEHDGTVYVSRGNKIYEVRDDISTDDGEDVKSIIKLKEMRTMDRMVLKRVMIDLYSREAGDATLTIGKLSMPLFKDASEDIIALDDDIVALDTDEIAGSEYVTLNKRCNYKLERIAPVITINRGALSIRKVNLLIAGVG